MVVLAQLPFLRPHIFEGGRDPSVSVLVSLKDLVRPELDHACSRVDTVDRDLISNGGACTYDVFAEVVGLTYLLFLCGYVGLFDRLNAIL